MMRRLFHILIGLMPLFLLASLFYWVVMTQSGLIFITQIIPSLIPGHLDIQKAQGSLNHKIDLTDVSYNNNLISFRAKNIELVWQPLQLINHNNLTFDFIMVKSGAMQINTLNSKKSSKWLHYPFTIQLKKLLVQQFNVNYDQQNIVLNNANLQGNYTIQSNNYQFTWQLVAKAHHYPLQSQGSMSISPETIVMPYLFLQSADSTIKANGLVNNHWQGQWQIDIKNLQHFIPNSTGQLHSVGTINGDHSHPIINATVFAKQLQYKQYQLKNLQSEFVMDPNFQKPWQIQLNANGFQYKKLIIDAISLHSQSSLDKQQFQLQLRQKDKQLSLTLAGQLHNKQWLGQLQQFNLQSKSVGNWQLNNPNYIALSPSYAQISNVVIQSPQGKIALNGVWQKQKSWAAQLLIDNFALKNLQFLLPENVQLQGQLKLNTSASQNYKQPIVAQAQLNLSSGSLQYPFNQQQQLLNFQMGLAKMTLDKKGFAATWQFNLNQNQGMTGDINLPTYQIGKPLLSQSLTGHVHIIPIALQTLQPFIPNTKNLQGTVNIDSTLQGTIQNPIIMGQLKLQNGQITIPSLNITLNNVQLNATGQPNSIIQYNGSANSGGGQMQLTGNTDLRKPGYFSVLQLQGKQFLAMNTPHYQIYASPQLTVQIQNKDIHLSGNIFIPQATLAPPDFKSQSIVLPDDVVFVNQQKPVNSTAFWNYYSQIELDLGDKINVNILGLQGQLLGSIQLNDVPQRPTTASGTLSIKNGQYTAYGQNLNVDAGRLIFTGGPLTNPGVSIQASRQVTTVNTSNILSSGVSNLPSTGNSSVPSITTPFFSQQTNTKVGINVQGTLKDPQITLFSEPAILSQSDILSYLLLNQPASQVSASGAQLLAQAASSMNLGGGQLQQVTQQLQKTFGLTQLSVGTTTYYNPQTASMIQNTALMVGKKITPNLYINYSVGLTAPINILQISYLLSSHWTLQSSTSSLANGIDLLYSFEHN